MDRKPITYWDSDDAVGDDADLWFLPQDPVPGASPLPIADRAQLFPFAEWRAAEAALAPDLAALTFDFGRLEERLRSAGDGARQRLALQEVAGLGWWMGDRVSADRLALWLELQIGATGDDGQALARGAWAVRRLTSGPAPTGPRRAEALAQLLGQAGPASPRITDVCDVLARLEPLHGAVQGAVLFHLWRITDPSPARDLESAVLAARLAGAVAGAAAFLPLSLAGFGALTVHGGAERRLSAWLAGAHQAVLAALLHLDRLAAWQTRAALATADLSGRTPPRLLRLLAQWPSLSAPLAEAQSGASRAAVQRNLDLFTARKLIREVTGQGRYRVWTAWV